MIKLKQAVIVEGKYDKIKLESLLDALIIPTDGFGIFKDHKKMDLIRLLAKTHGIIIMTDSDSAGFVIRSHIKGSIKEGKITHVYIPDILGKEKRKDSPSCEGKLGVEGVSTQMIMDALNKAGVFAADTEAGYSNNSKKITKADLFEDGLSGGVQSKNKRKLLYNKLNLPEHLSANALLPVLNAIIDYDEYKKLVSSL